jgi:hypothetical protein
VTVVLLLDPDAISFAGGAVCIGDEREGQIKLRLEIVVAFNAIF